MSDTKHTPGKWKVESYQHGQHGYSHEITSEDGTSICELFGLNYQSRDNADRIVLCCNCHDDLVAALKRTIHAMSKQGLDDGYPEIWKQAWAALDKAGEE